MADNNPIRAVVTNSGRCIFRQPAHISLNEKNMPQNTLFDGR
jgi:hypothetical protein